LEGALWQLPQQEVLGQQEAAKRARAAAVMAILTIFIVLWLYGWRALMRDNPTLEKQAIGASVEFSDSPSIRP